MEHKMSYRIKKVMSFEDSSLVVAIDFGTISSQYAFSYVPDFQSNPLNILKTSDWKRHRDVMTSIPSVVLLAPNKSFYALGYDAEEKYADLTERNANKGWFFFKRSEMNLHQTKSLRRTTTIKDVNGKEMPAMTIFTMAIKDLKDHLMVNLKSRVAESTEDLILWVVTVPAILDEGAKQFMMEAAAEAGIPGKRLILVSEPDAATFYSIFFPRKSMSYGKGRTITDLFEPGTHYIVLDCGGTADITVLKVKSNRTLQQVYHTTGGEWGDTKVDHEFYQFLVRLFGNDVLTIFKDEFMDDYFELFRGFESKKRTIKPDLEKLVSIWLPIHLLEIFKEQSEETLAEALSQTRYAKTVELKADKLRVDPKIVKDFFSQSLQRIIQIITDIMKSFQRASESKILLVSDFVASPMILETIRRSFPNNEIIASKDAVISGAVIFGHIQRTQHTVVSSGIGM